MKKALASLLILSICLTLLTSCVTEEKNTFFSPTFLSEHNLESMPAPVCEAGYYLRDGDTLYVNLHELGYVNYVKHLVRYYLKLREDVKYLGYCKKTQLKYGIIPCDVVGLITSDYDYSADKHEIVFSTADKLEVKNGNMLISPVKITVERTSGKLPTSGFEYNTVIRVMSGFPILAEWEPCYYEHAYYEQIKRPLAGLPGRVSVKICKYCDKINYFDESGEVCLIPDEKTYTIQLSPSGYDDFVVEYPTSAKSGSIVRIICENNIFYDLVVNGTGAAELYIDNEFDAYEFIMPNEDVVIEVKKSNVIID